MMTSELRSIRLTLTSPSSTFLSFCRRLRKSSLTLSKRRIFLSLIRCMISSLSLYSVLLILSLTSDNRHKHFSCRFSMLKYTSFSSSSRVYMYWVAAVLSSSFSTSRSKLLFLPTLRLASRYSNVFGCLGGRGFFSTEGCLDEPWWSVWYFWRSLDGVLALVIIS